MLKVFNKDATFFNTLGLGVLTDFIDDPLITEILKGEYYLEFTYKLKGKLSEELIQENIIVAKGQAFRIYTVKKDLKSIKILAKHIFFDLANNFLEDVVPTNKTSQTALSWILDNTQYPNNFNVSGDCSKVSSARYVRKNVIDAIYNADNAILKEFGGEPEFNNYNVIVNSHRGNVTGIDIRENKNLTGIEYNLDFSTVATRILPKGKDGLLLPNKYVDSPLINNYFQPIIKMIEYNDIDNAEDLQAKVESLFQEGIDKPLITLKIDFIELSKVSEYSKYQSLETAHLGDTCKVYVPKLNINANVRIVKTVYNCNLDRIVKLELGNVVPNIATSNAAIQNTINSMPSNMLEQAKLNATEMLNHPFNGTIYIDKDTGTLYLMDTNTIETAQNVWKWNLGGLGFSSTGINGTYTTAITQDGQIVADFITSGHINTSLIEGYGALVSRVDNVATYAREKNEINELHLTDTEVATGAIINLKIHGNTSNGALTLISDKQSKSIGESADRFMHLFELEERLLETENLYDELIIENSNAKLIKRLAENFNIISNSAFNYGAINGRGVETSSEYNIRSGYTAVAANTEYKIEKPHEEMILDKVFFYDANNIFISYENLLTYFDANTWYEKVFTTPASCNNIRVTLRTEDLNPVEYSETGQNVTLKFNKADVFELDETQEIDLGQVIIPTFADNTYIYIKNQNNLSYYCKYAESNDFTKTFATKAEMNMTAEDINFEVRKKVGSDEIISKINQTAEQLAIDANRININRNH